MKWEDLPPNVKEAMEGRGHSPDKVKAMSARDVFSEYCNWNGLIGWGNVLWHIMHHLEDKEST